MKKEKESDLHILSTVHQPQHRANGQTTMSFGEANPDGVTHMDDVLWDASKLDAEKD